jgi:hypothetical protein
MIVNKYKGTGGGGSSYTLPVAGVGDNGILGGVKVDGESISIDSNGVISAEAAGLEVTAFEDIDTTKGLEIYAAPQNYLINVDISDSEDHSDVIIKTVGTTNVLYKYVGDATMNNIPLRVYLCTMNTMLATYSKLILVAPDGSLIADQGEGVTDFTMPIITRIDSESDMDIPTAGAVKSYVDDLVGEINNELDTI